MRILLAPMEGLLDHLLRDALTQVGGNASAPGGIDLCVAEFIRITDTLLPASSFYRVVPELKNGCRTPSGVPVRVQILGSDPICMAENAAKLASLGAYGIDINFGCPAKTVNRHGGGAVLLKNPEVMFAIVQTIRTALPAQTPLTAKMRLGYDTPEHALECAQALADGGAEEIVVHARTKTDGYKPPAYWEWIARIREHVRVPIVANGEIWNVSDAQRCREISGCDDIMIGRGAVANPALALMIAGARDDMLPWSEMQQLLHGFWLSVEQHINPRNRNGRLKQWLRYLARDYEQAQQQFDTIRRMTQPEQITAALFA
ncbi:MAG: dusC [Verrucomicrobiaceae bacterium]|nr:dusC [Verrucomicrobiaceae bacterium]